MAGIGFELRQAVYRNEGLFGNVRTYFCAGLVSSGPWIMTTLALTVLSILGPSFAPTNTDYVSVRCLITYAFAFSLITVGVIQMPLTRCIADDLYAGEHERVLPAFSAMMGITAAVQSAIALIFCLVFDFGPARTIAATVLYATVSMTWVALIWLSVTRDFDKVLYAYLIGTVVAVACVMFLTARYGTVGALSGYAAGQAVTLILLVRSIYHGIERSQERNLDIVKRLSGFPILVGIGLFYNFAIWIDKFVFWIADGIGPHSWTRFHPLYDTSCFLAYLTVLPALAINLIHLETGFYERYRKYMNAVLSGLPLSLIEERRAAMVANLRDGAIGLLRVQGAVTILCVVFAPNIIGFLGMGEATVWVFRMCCVGAFFHVMLLITILVQMYFDLRMQALISGLTFLVLNTALAIWSVSAGIETYGVGYAVAALLSLLVAFSLLSVSLRKLEMILFTCQPFDGLTARADA